MNTTLIIMADGIGSRFGEGIKQLTQMGPNGEIIMDYSIHDAKEAGFNKVVFIILKDIFKEFEEIIGNRIKKQIDVEYVFQELDDLPEGFEVPEGRTKPWGTGQAVLCCKDVVKEPFVIINADDYYGASAFATILDKLLSLKPNGEGAMVGYLLKNTVSDNGTVSRGVCQQENGHLQKVKETLKIKKYPDGRIADLADPDHPMDLDPESVVSMNFWGFTPWIFEQMEEYFDAFLKELSPEELKAECLLPVLVDRLITSGQMTVSVLHTDAVWFGVTYQEDRPVVEKALKSLHDQGIYPNSLKD